MVATAALGILVARHFADLDPTGGSGSGNSVTVELIGASAIIIIALIGAFSGTRKNRPHVDEEARRLRVTDGEYHALLQNRAVDAEHGQANAENRALKAEGRILVLERFIWLRRYDPNKIVTGNEEPADVRA